MLTNCIFSGNSAANGGGIRTYSSNAALTNCTFSGNWADYGGGIYNYEGSPTLTNCILWGDTPQEIYVSSGTPVVTYSDVQGGWSGDGGNNIEVDPCFADPNGDYHLKSQAGRWKPSFYTKLDPTGDDFVSLLDCAAFASYWQQQGHAIPADFDNSGVVDFSDLASLEPGYLMM
jgi:hypothetical protein